MKSPFAIFIYNLITPIKSSIDWGDIVVDIAPADQEEINMFMDLINHTKRVYHHNEIVNSIIQEEAAYYLSDSLFQNKIFLHPCLEIQYKQDFH